MATFSDGVVLLAEAFGADVKALIASINNKITKGDLFKSVADFGADKTGVNKTATFTAFTNAHAAVAEGGSIYVPEGIFDWDGAVAITKTRITVYGPGIVRGCFDVGITSDRTESEARFTGLRFVKPVNTTAFTVKGYADDSYFIRVLRCRRVKVDNCEFFGAAYPVYIPALSSAASHDVSMMRVKDNFFDMCDWAVFGDIYQLSATNYEDIADSQIIGNIVNKSFVGGFWFKGIDGVQINDNVFFMQNYNNQGGRAAEKKQNIRIDLCNWTHITGNNLFEAGLEAILIVSAKQYQISGNLIAWAGQQAMSDAISVTAASPTYSGEWSSGVITGNNIQFYTKSAIKVAGNHIELALGPNVVRYSPSAESYKGPGGLTALAAAVHYRYDLSAVTGLKLVDISILDQVSVREGQFDLFAGHPYVRAVRRQEVFGIAGSSYRGPLTFTTGQAQVVMNLKDATDSSSTYSGQIRIVAKSGTASLSKQAYYVLNVTKVAADSSELIQVTAQGYDAGSAADDPAFIWTINSTNNQLIARAVGATAGAFHFTVFFNDNLIVG